MSVPAPSWLVSLIGRALHRCRRGQGFVSPTSLSFFQAFFSQLHKLRYYMAESVFAMRLVNLRSVTCYTDQTFNENAHFGALNLFTSEKRLKLSYKTSINLEDLDFDFVLQHFKLCLFVKEGNEETNS